MPTHKKGHDKDKYYHLAKDQGYRSRAAFKLIQINKRFDFLSKSKVLVDLCAAPGGWCQVAAKFMPAGSIVLGVDLLPIRPIRNVKTIVSDITTAECRRTVSQELQGWKADVFLCDGAPNIGSAYNKDAYVQNELVLAALKSATDHLVEGGTFCTKVYRSKDYNALIWVLQQLFEDVQAIKPNSSRSQSSEIFIVCQKYIAPQKIDPKLLDPNHVFKEVADPGLAKIDVLHKSYDKHNKRHRTGYDENLGISLTVSAPLIDFIKCQDAVRMLTDTNKFTITTEECQKLKEHPKTTPEMLICFEDLRVLGKIDFKKMIKWRYLIRKEYALDRDASLVKSGEGETAVVEVKEASAMTEEDIQQEISGFRQQIQQQDRREKKKDRRNAAKERTRQAMGIRNNAFEVSEEVELFSLRNTLRDDADNLGDVDVDDDNLGAWEEEMEENKDQGELIELPSGDLEQELEEQYQRYVNKTRRAKEGKDENLVHLDTQEELTEQGRTRSSKRARLARTPNGIVSRQHEEDEELALPDEVMEYAKALTGRADNDEDSEDDSEDDSGSDDNDNDKDVIRPAAASKGVPAASYGKAPLMSRVDQWYSHPIFKQTLLGQDKNNDDDNNNDMDVEDVSKQGRKRKSVADEVLAEMPKTDREVRQEKRKKAVARTERRAAKKNSAIGEDEEEARMSITSFKVAPSQDAEERANRNLDEDEALLALNNPKEAAVRKRIREGMGKAGKDVAMDSASSHIELVPAESMHPDLPDRCDDRTYDSDEEQYDTHDRAMTLALGTLMLRKSRQKALVDASYNRFAWNDAKDLPEWFVDDEMKHNRPQVPVPGALLQQIKSRYQMTGTREIKKVAEARARKKKRAMNKLKAAKRQANMLADNTELSERQKIKSISRALKTSKVDKPSKVYVVTKKTGGASSGTSSGGKGKLKFVDKRLKKDGRKVKQKKANAKKRKH